MCKIIDFACPFDSRIEEREKDKMKGYNDLKRELKKIWDMPVKVIHEVVVEVAYPEVNLGTPQARSVSVGKSAGGL